MAIETKALTDFAGLADPSATPIARPGNPDFAPFLSVATVATNAVTAPAQPAKLLDEAMLANLLLAGANVVPPAQAGVGKPTSPDTAPVPPSANAGQENQQLQSAFDIVQQLAATATTPAPTPTPVPVNPVQSGVEAAVEAAVAETALPVLPGTVAAPKPHRSDKAEAEPAISADEGTDDAEPAPPPIQAAIVAPPAVAPPPAPVAAAIVSQDQPEHDATTLPPRANGRPAALASTLLAPLPAAIATPIAASTDAPALAPTVAPAGTAQADGERRADNAPAATPQLPTVTAPAPARGDKPADYNADIIQPAATPQTAAPAYQHAAAPAPAPVANLAPAAAMPPAVGPAIAKALDDLIVAGASDDQWVHRLASDIQTLASGDRREAHLQLRPQELGGMAIRLEMEDRQTRVHFTVENAAVKELIADAAPRLQHLVEARGFRLDQATVEVSRPSDTATANNSSNGSGNSGSSAGTGSGSGRQGQPGAEPQNFRAPRSTAAADARAHARALASGKFERFA